MRAIMRCLALGVLLSASGMLSAQVFSFQKVDVPGASATNPKGINARGDVVGLTVDGDGNGRGFLYHQGSFKLIEVPGSSFTNAVGINSRGDIVGRWSDAGGNNHGYLLSNGRFKTFDVKGCDSGTVPHGVNDVGDIVGQCVDVGGNTHGFLLAGGKTTILDFPGADLTDAYKITNEGEIVGFYTDAGYLRTSSGNFQSIQVPGGINVGARGVNESLSIVGEFDGVSDGITYGFLLESGRYRTIAFPGAAATVASDINNRSTIVGDYFDVDGNDHGFIAHARE